MDEKDAALRDFSAAALKEFLKWSIKHTPLLKQDQEATEASSKYVNVKSILKRIFSFLNHPSCAKRLGAALAWNSIYAIFREEETLVNRHVFELLYYLIESLALSEQDDKMYGTQEQTKSALDHVERIIKAKVELLNEKRADRVKPPGWAEAVLEVAVRWLMRQCGRSETECRHKSMELAYKLAPCIHGINEARDYFQIKLKMEGELYFLARFEGSQEKKDILKDSICNFKILPDLGVDSFQLSYVKSWLAMLIAPLDCYAWVFSERLLTPQNLFSSGKSCIWNSLEYFIEKIMPYELHEVLESVYYKKNPKLNSFALVCTPNEIEDFNKAKCTAIIRFIDFLCTMIGIFSSSALALIPDCIWSEKLFSCLLNMCLSPQVVGFNLNDLEVYTNLPLKTRAFFKVFTSHASKDLQQRFKTLIKSSIEDKKQFQSAIESVLALRKPPNQAADETVSRVTTDWLKLSQLISGYEQLSEFKFYELSLDLNRIIFDYLCEQTTADNKGYEQESLTCVEAKTKLLNLCLGLNYASVQQHKSAPGVDDYLIEILDKYLFHTQMSTFFSYYRNEICTWICKRHVYVIPYLLGKLKLNFAKCMSLLISVADYLCVDKQQRKTYGTKVVLRLYDNWAMFSDYWQAAADLENKVLLVSLLTKSILIETIPFGNQQASSRVTEMYMSLLVDTKTKLNFKCKLLDLLYFFSEAPVPFTLKSYMGQFVAQFPLKSTELVKGDDAYNDYVNAIRKILFSIEMSGSFDLINVMVNLFCREAEHICSDEIQACFIRCIKRQEGHKQTALIKHYWEGSFKNLETSNDERKALIFKKVLINFLKHCEKPTFLEFMCANVVYLIDILDKELKVVICANSHLID